MLAQEMRRVQCSVRWIDSVEGLLESMTLLELASMELKLTLMVRLELELKLVLDTEKKQGLME